MPLSPLFNNIYKDKPFSVMQPPPMPADQFSLGVNQPPQGQQPFNLGVDPALTQPPSGPADMPPMAPNPPVEAPPPGIDASVYEAVKKRYPQEFQKASEAYDQNRVTADDLSNQRQSANMINMLGGLSDSLAKVGNVGGEYSKGSAGDYGQGIVKQQADQIAQRQSLAKQAQDQMQTSLKGYQDASLAPIEMQQKQQALQKGQLDQQAAKLEFENKQKMADPNSQESVITRGMLTKMGVPVGDDVTAATASRLLDQAQKVKNMEIQAKNQAETIAARKARDALMAEANAINRGFKFEQADFKRYKEADTGIDAAKAKAGSPFAGYKRKLDNAEAAGQVVFTPNGYIKDLNPLEFTEAGSAINSLLGGSNAVAAVQHFVPQTKGMSLAKMKEWLTDHPQPAGLTGFSAWAGNMIGREQGLYEGKLQQERINTLHLYKDLRERDPAKFQELLTKAGLTDKEFESRDPNVTYIKVDEKTGKVDRVKIPYSKFQAITRGRTLQPGEVPEDVAELSGNRKWTPPGASVGGSGPAQVAQPTMLPQLGQGIPGLNLANANEPPPPQITDPTDPAKRVAWTPGGRR